MESYQNWHPNFPVNLQNCKDEPIHIPGAVQTFGFLIAFEPADGSVRAISANVSSVLPQLANFERRAVSIYDHIQLDSQTSFGEEVLRRKGNEGRTLLRIKLPSHASKVMASVLYRSGDLMVLEVEFDESGTTHAFGRAYLANLQLVLRDLQSCNDLAALMGHSASIIKRITGFDRVMIYRYDAEWNGEIVAEAKEPALEAFLGLHYPASDIPVQARRLYEKNWIRIIPTVNYQPVPILPTREQKIDLSHSLLRSVSPIHIRYLKNMGVNASMSISLMVEGKLWGLVACHHYSSALYVPLEVRLGCEALGQLISWQIQAAQSSDAYRRIADGEAKMTQALQRFAEHSDFRDATHAAEADLLAMFDCTGIVLRLGHETLRIGQVPNDLFVDAINRILVNSTIFEPFATAEARNFEALNSVTDNERACGLMALPLAPRHNYFIACFRPEKILTVNWAGNPHEKDEPQNFDNPDFRLQPRGSFALWQETNRGRSVPWTEQSRDLLKRFALLFMKIVIERKEILEKSNQELKSISQAKDEFVAVVSHELRTPLNAIIGWTELALSGDIGDEQQVEAFRIIQRNARSQNQLIGDLLDISRILSGKMKLSVKNMRVSEVVESVVLSFGPAARAKEIDVIQSLDRNADSIIGDHARIQQVVWNLLSNAVKFSPKHSKMWVSVKRVNSHIEFEVRDQGAGLARDDLDRIFDRFQQVDSSVSRKAGGLGLGLSISKHIVELHGGRIWAQSEGLGKGSVFTASFPISPVAPETAGQNLPIDDQYGMSSKGSAVSRRLAGEVILIAEDEADALSFLQMLLTSHGAKVFTARNGQQALDLLKQNKDEIGIVLSDIGMPDVDGYRLAESVRSSTDSQVNSVCMVALTAFGRPQDRILALKAGFDSYIAKPVMQEELLTVLESACKTKKR